MHHERAPEATAGAIPREEAEVKAGVTAGLVARVTPWRSPQSRWPRSPSRPPSVRRVTFREPKVEPNSEGGAESYPPEPPISDVETWLEWQACQLSTPSWWLELRAIPGVKGLWKLIHKIHASFSIPKVRMRLRVAVWEYVTFTSWDILQGLGEVHRGATNQWPQTSLSNQAVPPLGKESSGLDTSFTEATTQTTSLAATHLDTVRCGNQLFGMESETWYLLVVTTSIEQLSLGPSSDNLERSSTAPSRGNTFQNPRMAAVFSGSIWAVDYEGATVRELEDWCGT